ncbi:patatin-like phospholipase family protein [Neptunicella marina]|uniref:Patatin-like phospholipase family protein n=1 Tax=Neptunicella marina TaxID=2125989 RepID=A0A8J6IT53_9ALTE|nr:patatin-like phospholipase family protein [Neptunicella marina]MBC3765345.1 patatin-like phospholipase family protein [Neptunicella marina]
MSGTRPQGAALADDKAKRALILPGGGLRLSYAAGVAKRLFEGGLTFEFMDGTSGGSLILAMLLSGLDIEEICQRWSSMQMAQTLALPSFSQIVADDGFIAAGSASAFRQNVFPHLGINFERLRQATGIKASFNVGNFATKCNQVFPHQHITEDHLVAGMSLPGVFPPVSINGELYMDSGFIQDANLLHTVKAGARELWVVWIMGNIPEYRTGLLNWYVQMLEVAANAALHKELLQIANINSRIAAGETVYGHTQPIRLHFIRPPHPLPLDSALYTGEICHADLIKQGYEDTTRYMLNTTQEGDPFDPAITKMTEQHPGIQFKETMSGGFALGTSDYKQGCDKGQWAGHVLAMHAQVDIDDIDQFVETGKHPGRLSGSIDFEPMGKGIPAHSGVFNLFYPADKPGLKLMVYELAFTHDGQDYYLAGKKEVEDDTGFDLWSDTTTLYTQLHKGTDKSGEVVGAGILTLGVIDLIKLVSTMRVLHAKNTPEKLATIGKFGRFFMGELWDTYAKHA